MDLFLIGLILFLGVHAIPIVPSLRQGLVDRLSEAGFKAAFAIVSLIGFALIIVGYADTYQWNRVVWAPPAWMSHITVLLMWPALIALVAAYVPSRIHSALKHPMLVAIKIWALAHLLANGDLVSMVLFGSFLAYAVVDRISVKRRGALGPLGAASGGLGGDIVIVVVGTAVYAFLLFYGHEWLFGVAPLAGMS